MSKSARLLAIQTIRNAVLEAKASGLVATMVEECGIISQAPVPDENGKLWARGRPSPTVTLRVTLTDPSILEDGKHPEDSKYRAEPSRLHDVVISPG